MMKLVKRSLLALVMVAPTISSAAMLRFDVAATTDLGVLGEVGLLSGSYFVVDTSIQNSSSDSTSSLFENSIVGGHVDTYDPINGSISADITADNSGSISATNDGTNTQWTIQVEGESAQQSAVVNMSFSGLDLFANMEDDYSLYNDSFLAGYVTANNLDIDFTQFEVSDTTPSPVPIPPTFLLMASSLVMLLWRSNISFSNVRSLLATS